MTYIFFIGYIKKDNEKDNQEKVYVYKIQSRKSCVLIDLNSLVKYEEKEKKFDRGSDVFVNHLKLFV